MSILKKSYQFRSGRTDLSLLLKSFAFKKQTNKKLSLSPSTQPLKGRGLGLGHSQLKQEPCEKVLTFFKGKLLNKMRRKKSFENCVQFREGVDIRL